MDLQEVERGEHRIDYSGSEQGQVVRSCKHNNETSGFIKCKEFLE
jgi:hypothetical protein